MYSLVCHGKQTVVDKICTLYFVLTVINNSHAEFLSFRGAMPPWPSSGSTTGQAQWTKLKVIG